MPPPQCYIGGKAARAKAARYGNDNPKHTTANVNVHNNSNNNHPAEDDRTFLLLEELEKQERIKYYPQLVTRKAIPMDNHGTMIIPAVCCTSTGTTVSQDRKHCDLSNCHIRGNLTIEHIISTGKVGEDEKEGEGEDPSTSTSCTTTSIPSLSPSLSLPISSLGVVLSNIIHLNVSQNELWELPSSTEMRVLSKNLQTLDISRNWFEELPFSIGTLHQLTSLDASHNLLRSSPQALLLVPPPPGRSQRLPNTILNSIPNNTNATNPTCSTISILRSLQYLTELNLEFNTKCNHQKLYDKIENELYNNTKNTNTNTTKNKSGVSCCRLKMTITAGRHTSSSATVHTKQRPINYFVGETPALRNPSLLRAQLECWSTTKLRRRLISDFGQVPLPEHCARSVVMDHLLRVYAQEQKESEPNQKQEEQEQWTANEEGLPPSNLIHNYNPHQYQRGIRKVIRTSGILIEDTQLLDRMVVALQGWSQAWTNTNQERSAINATNYMILTAPESCGKKNYRKAAIKLQDHRTIWELAQQMMVFVDPDFATKYTALAVTHNFIGSPHIDRQNVGPFYGISFGDFDEVGDDDDANDGCGGIMVECSARIVANINTKHRLARVDG